MLQCLGIKHMHTSLPLLPMGPWSSCAAPLQLDFWKYISRDPPVCAICLFGRHLAHFAELFGRQRCWLLRGLVGALLLWGL